MLAAAILTGGLARRFQGRDKSRLPAWPGGPAILDHQLAVLGPIAFEILIVTSRERAADFTARPTPPPVRIVVDRYPGSGPLGAIVTAFDATTASDLIVLAGDMPGVTGDALRDLARRHTTTASDVTIPETPRGLEPLCAIYGRACRDPLTAALASGDLSLQRAIHPLRLQRVDAGLLGPADLFRNVNTPGDL